MSAVLALVRGVGVLLIVAWAVAREGRESKRAMEAAHESDSELSQTRDERMIQQRLYGPDPGLSDTPKAGPERASDGEGTDPAEPPGSGSDGEELSRSV